jgi:Xaa-Pro aminopeptidase
MVCSLQEKGSFMMFTAPTSFSLFKQRRDRLIECIKSQYAGAKGVIIVSAGFETDRYQFRQESSFYYLTGIVEPAGVLCLHLDGKAVLYVPDFSTPRSDWAHVTVSGPADAHKVGVDEVRYLGEKNPGFSFRPVFTREKYTHLLNDVAAEVTGNANVFTLLDQSRDGYLWHINLYGRMQEWLPQLKKCTIDVSTLLHEMRRIKDEYEIDLIYKAVQITNMAQKAAAAVIHDGMYEYELQSAVECIFSQVAGANPSFPSIIASGKNTTVLHYTQRNEQLKSDDLVVVDIGAEYGFYAADITRTFPVGKKFTPRQREVYQVVLEVQAYVESLARPGLYLKNAEYPERSLHHLAMTFLQKRGFDKYFNHGIGHFLGLDVHDVGILAEPLQPGDVFTLEPGIYIPSENLGIRIEDDYVMADDGVVCLSYDLPKQAEEIERLMLER